MQESGSSGGGTTVTDDKGLKAGRARAITSIVATGIMRDRARETTSGVADTADTLEKSKGILGSATESVELATTRYGFAAIVQNATL